MSRVARTIHQEEYVLIRVVHQEVRDWLRKPENRTRYLDDLVWLIHDRFGIVCSTTTMSKMKRKWLRVIEYEETGRPLDETTRQALLETHPDLDILQQPDAMPQEEDGLAQQQVLPGALPGAQMGMVPPPPAMMGAPEAMMHPALQAHGRNGQMEVPIEPQIDSQLEQQIQREIARTSS